MTDIKQIKKKLKPKKKFSTRLLEACVLIYGVIFLLALLGILLGFFDKKFSL